MLKFLGNWTKITNFRKSAEARSISTRASKTDQRTKYVSLRQWFAMRADPGDTTTTAVRASYNARTYSGNTALLYNRYHRLYK